jgi:hypothetical protein
MKKLAPFAAFALAGVALAACSGIAPNSEYRLTTAEQISMLNNFGAVCDPGFNQDGPEDDYANNEVSGLECTSGKYVDIQLDIFRSASFVKQGIISLDTANSAIGNSCMIVGRSWVVYFIPTIPSFASTNRAKSDHEIITSVVDAIGGRFMKDGVKGGCPGANLNVFGN